MQKDSKHINKNFLEWECCSKSKTECYKGTRQGAIDRVIKRDLSEEKHWSSHEGDEEGSMNRTGKSTAGRRNSNGKDI